MSRNMKKNTVLFDFGNTLVQYHESRTMVPIFILEQSVNEVKGFLKRLNLLTVSHDEIWKTVKIEGQEADDHRVRPMVNRLCHIFQIQESDLPKGGTMEMCRRFMGPMSVAVKCYEDTVPALRRLKQKGIKIAIVSNAPWGCPAPLCRQEVDRFSLSRFFNDIVFCTDVGWRKPAKQIFEFALNRLQEPANHCLFVGDHPEWDFDGPRSMGMEAVLIDRGVHQLTGKYVLKTLEDIFKWMD